jgi:hypothetical protein
MEPKREVEHIDNISDGDSVSLYQSESFCTAIATERSAGKARCFRHGSWCLRRGQGAIPTSCSTDGSPDSSTLGLCLPTELPGSRQYRQCQSIEVCVSPVLMSVYTDSCSSQETNDDLLQQTNMSQMDYRIAVSLFSLAYALFEGECTIASYWSELNINFNTIA